MLFAGITWGWSADPIGTGYPEIFIRQLRCRRRHLDANHRGAVALISYSRSLIVLRLLKGRSLMLQNPFASFRPLSGPALIFSNTRACYFVALIFRPIKLFLWEICWYKLIIRYDKPPLRWFNIWPPMKTLWPLRGGYSLLSYALELNSLKIMWPFYWT